MCISLSKWGQRPRVCCPSHLRFSLSVWAWSGHHNCSPSVREMFTHIGETAGMGRLTARTARPLLTTAIISEHRFNLGHNCNQRPWHCSLNTLSFRETWWELSCLALSQHEIKIKHAFLWPDFYCRLNSGCFYRDQLMKNLFMTGFYWCYSHRPLQLKRVNWGYYFVNDRI